MDVDLQMTTDGLIEAVERLMLRRRRNVQTRRRAEVIAWRYGPERLSMVDIAQRLGVSRNRVVQLRDSGLHLMRVRASQRWTDKDRGELPAQLVYAVFDRDWQDGDAVNWRNMPAEELERLSAARRRPTENHRPVNDPRD